MAEHDVLQVEEQALHEQEQGLIQMEAQLHEQEQGLVQMERAFRKRNKAFVNLASYVSDQEKNLINRAESIGPRAKALVDQMIGRVEQEGGKGPAEIGMLDARTSILERRREVLAVRMALIEERETLYAERHEGLERAEGNTADLEQKLLHREREISEALRTLISNATELMGDDEDGDDEDDDDEASGLSAAGSGGVTRDVAEATAEEASLAATLDHRPAGNAGARKAARGDDMTGRRRQGNKHARTNQFRITLEAQLDSGEAHEFFSYVNDGPDDIPGLFVATPNLLKVGREVRVRVGCASELLEATGIVAWRRQRGEAGGPPGMGIELLNLTEPDRATVFAWVEQYPAATV